MAKKNASKAGVNGTAEGLNVQTTDTKVDGGLEQGSLASDPLPTVKVNNAHLQEIKSALDDTVKKVCSSIMRLMMINVADDGVAPRIPIIHTFTTSSDCPSIARIPIGHFRPELVPLLSEGRVRSVETRIMDRRRRVLYAARGIVVLEKMG